MLHGGVALGSMGHSVASWHWMTWAVRSVCRMCLDIQVSLILSPNPSHQKENKGE